MQELNDSPVFKVISDIEGLVEIPEDAREEFTYFLKNARNLLFVDFKDGKDPLYVTDYGEPEDSSFLRDYNWIIPALKRAYDKGITVGRKMEKFVEMSKY